MYSTVESGLTITNITSVSTTSPTHASYLLNKFITFYGILIWTDNTVAQHYQHIIFDNILNVIGNSRNEMSALYLTQTYCLPSLLYSCESVKPLQYYCSPCIRLVTHKETVILEENAV